MSTTAPTRLPDGKFAPARVVAGGIVWEAKIDNQPYGSWIGFQLAVEHGVVEKPRPAKGETSS